MFLTRPLLQRGWVSRTHSKYTLQVFIDTEFHSSRFDCAPALEELLLWQIKLNNVSRSQDFKTKGSDSRTYCEEDRNTVISPSNWEHFRKTQRQRGMTAHLYDKHSRRTDWRKHFWPHPSTCLFSSALSTVPQGVDLPQRIPSSILLRKKKMP